MSISIGQVLINNGNALLTGRVVAKVCLVSFGPGSVSFQDLGTSHLILLHMRSLLCVTHLTKAIQQGSLMEDNWSLILSLFSLVIFI